VDALCIELSTQKPDGVIEIEEEINIDVSSDGSIVGIEFIDAAKKMPLTKFFAGCSTEKILNRLLFFEVFTRWETRNSQPETHAPHWKST